MNVNGNGFWIDDRHFLLCTGRDDEGSFYHVRSSQQIVLHRFYAPRNSDSPAAIAKKLLADDWFEVINDSDLECSLNYTYDESGKLFIVEDHGECFDYRQYDLALTLFTERCIARKERRGGHEGR